MVGASGRAWVRAQRRPRSIRPMSAAHGFCFQRRSPHVSAHVTSTFPRDVRAFGPRRKGSLRRTDRSRWSVVSSSRRSSGVPLMLRRPRASPADRMSTGVGPRPQTRSQVETRRPRPTPPSRVNGCLGLALARSTFSLSSGSRPDRRPDPTAPARSVPFGDRCARGERELLPCHRPTRHSTCPQSSSALLRAPFGARRVER